MYTVTVLTPKGRRQKVKVTPDTTLIQVLEEVCTKHGFNSNDFDLRHHNKVLDISTMFRFTNLPNNAQLEMTEAVKLRHDSPVTVGLQLESGERLTGVFSPSESLLNVIIKLNPEGTKVKTLTVVYMRKEISGVDNLKKTTLKSLGLTNGSAMFRILQKSPEELRNQASVPSTTSSSASAGSDPDERIFRELLKKEILNEKLSSSKDPELHKSSVANSVKKEDVNRGWGKIFENLLRDEKSKKLPKSNRSEKNEAEIPSSCSNQPNNQFEDFKSQVSPSTKVKTESLSSSQPEEESKVILLGERNALAFSLNNIKPSAYKEEPDDFYELTIHDAKLLLKQAKQLCAELENAPLMTAAQREFERDKKILALLHQYKKTVIRIKFPDRTVLQGTFFSLETISAVEKFVTEYLESPKLQFYLYTTPPKVILKPESRLIECGCVPSCVVYFGLASGAQTPSQYLRSDVLDKLSTPSAAALHAYEARGKERKIFDFNESESESEKRKWDSGSSDAGTSRGHEYDGGSTSQEVARPFRLPKWFKSNKNDN